MTRREVRDLIRAIIEEEQLPLSHPYWDDGAAPLEDAAIDRIIAASQMLLEA